MPPAPETATVATVMVPRPSPPIVVEGLCKRYGDRQVLDGVDLEVGRGEVLALLGPNGAGKTTTVEILEGYRTATAGSVRVLGFEPWTHPRQLQERIGVVLQECGFPNHLRVGEMIDAWRSYYPRCRPAAELLELVELVEERNALVRQLSGGQRRRLDLALALAGDPDLIFLDEPTTGFDPEARRRCWAAIDNLRALGKTVLLTTHYLDEAERLANRVAILCAGRIRAVGTPHELSHLANAPTSISFSPQRIDYDRCASLLGEFDTRVEAGLVSVRTVQPSSVLRLLLDRVGQLPDLQVIPPTLEDTYLKIVGHGQDTTT